jgi:hypothetical protein
MSHSHASVRRQHPELFVKPGLLAVTLFVCIAPACRAQSHDSMPGMAGMSGADSADRHAAVAAEEAMSGPMMTDPHMVMTPHRPPAAGDSVRAAALVAQMRRDLARFKNVDSAIANGYRPLFPGLPQPVYHFTNLFNAVGERLRFDPARPTSLLYRRDPSGGYSLVGAMYDDAPDTPLDELDARVPLSIAHWHRHVNWSAAARRPRALARVERRSPRIRPQEPDRDRGRMRCRRRALRSPSVRVDGARERVPR